MRFIGRIVISSIVCLAIRAGIGLPWIADCALVMLGLILICGAHRDRMEAAA